MPRPLEEAKEGDEVLYFTHNNPRPGIVHRFTKSMIFIRINAPGLKLGYSERRFYLKNGCEVGDRWNRVSLPTIQEKRKYQEAVKHHNLVKKLRAVDWRKLTTETLEGIERIADCEENKIK